MTEPDNIRVIQTLLRQSIGELAPHCQFLVRFLLALLAQRTVGLPWIASAVSRRIGASQTGASAASCQKQIQRFLSDFRVRPEAFAKVVARFLPDSPWILVMDRTNWFWGKQPVNLLVLAVLVDAVAVPLLWLPLERDGVGRDGASDTGHRIRLMEQFLTLFGNKSYRGNERILYLTGDREFIGADWIAWLCRNHVPFRIRLRCSDRITDGSGKAREVWRLFRSGKASRGVSCLSGRFDLWESAVCLGGRRLENGDYLIVASNERGNLLEDYRNRWSIECLFQALKGRGFELEQTRVTCPDRLGRLFGLLTLGYLLCVRIGESLPEEVCKSTGRLRKSRARRGLEVANRVAMWLLGEPPDVEKRLFFQAFVPVNELPPLSVPPASSVLAAI